MGAFRTASTGLAAAFLAAIAAGCSKPAYDTSTPQQAIDAVQAMLADGRPELLPTMIHIEARDIVYDDGVTEASAIENVRDKTGDMLAQLWRVTQKLQARYPSEVQKELELAKSGARARGFGAAFARFLADPFSFLEEQRDRLVAEDLGDGTAALLVDGEPAFGGVLTMVETGDGWRLSIPVEAARSSGYWPDTRHEWAVVASIMLSAENALADFERKLDRGDFRTLRQASEQAGLQLGGSVAVQSVIYASMKEKGPDAPAAGGG
ncbi:MAG: hypothetical protein KDA22_16995 [Phycisphaerales bacterium]|nr:hypothetical protein [Phycisphaerales bacterium]